MTLSWRSCLLLERRAVILAAAVAFLMTLGAAQLVEVKSVRQALALIEITDRDHVLFLYNSLDLNSLKAQEALRQIPLKAAGFTMLAVDVQEPSLSWLAALVDAFAFPTVRVIRRQTGGPRMIDSHDDLAFHADEILKIFRSVY